MTDDDQPGAGDEPRRSPDPPTPAGEPPAAAPGGDAGPAVAGGVGDDGEVGARHSPLWLRMVGFVAVLAAVVAMVVVVLARQGERAEQASSAAVTARTVPVPADILGTTTSKAPPPLPAGGTTVAVPRTGLTTDQVATALEAKLPVETGWTHAVSCGSPRPIAAGEVLECAARTEPPIKEVGPSTVLVVVLDDGGRFTWQRGTSGPVTLAALAEDGLTCADLAARGYPYVSALAWWNLHGRPPALDPSGAGRPCADAYPPAEVEAAFAKAAQA
ncbi:MAG: hypothetical protein R2726_02575 [Acidimicrobiales bacterium]